MINTNGSLMTSSFIPFCSLGTDFSVLGEYVTNLTFPVCTMFQATVYKGNLCYSLERSKVIKPKRDVFQGKESGLMLILDTNSQKSVEIPYEKESLINQNRKSQVRIHIGTLAPYTGYGPGDYRLSALKQITGTESFLIKANTDEECTNMNLEKCMRKNAEGKNQACSCKPFEFGSAFDSKQVLFEPGCLEKL